MKKTFEYLALLWMGFVMAGCADDELVNAPVHSGDEIVFGASASAEVGNQNAKLSRTAYGEVAGDKIALNWKKGDCIDIFCPEALDVKQAEYEVQVNPDMAPSNQSSLLTRISVGKGLQWSDAPTHNFFGIYPSVNSVKLNEQYITKDELGLRKAADGGYEATGYLPVTQTNSAEVEQIPEVKMIDGRKTYVVEPDMRYAYMMSHSAVQTSGASNCITLNFTPIVTALEFQITAETFLNQNQGKKSEIQLTSCVLSSADGTDICGKFVCNNKGEIVNANPTASAGAHNQITVEIPRNVVLSKDGTPSCNVTFFLLPTQVVKAGNLKLKIFYQNNGTVQVKTAVVNRDIHPKKKYFFRNMVMPPIDADINGSLWFTAIEDNVLMSQLSIPCAGNTFSNNATGGLYREQVLNYEELWNLGVRGFEFVNQTDARAKTLAGQKFVCAEEELKDNATFGQAMQTLVNKLNDPVYKGEFLLILAKYHAVNDGFVPQRYVKDLCSALGSLSGVTKDRFVKLDGNKTVADLRGKIAVVVRPADDDYLKFQNGTNTALTSSLKVVDNAGSDWSQNVVVVHNWGKAYDRWDMRYPGYAREATWADGHMTGSHAAQPTSVPRFEDFLWASSTSGTTFRATGGEDGIPYKDLAGLPKANPIFKHTTSADFDAQIQEWARVIPTNANYSTGNGVYTNYYTERGVSSWNRYLWVRWPSSIDEKKQAIASLMDKSVKRDELGLTSSMFVNVLSGYYPTTNHMQGVIPFKFNFYLQPGWNVGSNTVQPAGQGNGGNYAALAAELNTYMFNLLSRRIGVDGSQGGPKLKEGPFGIVVMDYIGATEADYAKYAKDEFKTASYADAALASRALTYMVMMNNFKFPLKRAGNVNPAPQVNIEVGSTDEVVVTD